MIRPSLLVSGAALVALTAFAPAQVTFDSLDFVVGDGPQLTGLVIQWESGANARALAWGYRHDGTKTVFDALTALATWTPPGGSLDGGDDDRLFLYSERFGFGDAIYGLGYDRDDDGVSGKGFATGATPDDATALDADDAWRTGWASNGYWSLQNSAVGVSPTGWMEAATGASGQTLTNGGWHALAFAPSPTWSVTVTSFIDAAPAPVPEPASMAVLALGLAALKRRRRDR